MRTGTARGNSAWIPGPASPTWVLVLAPLVLLIPLLALGPAFGVQLWGFPALAAAVGLVIAFWNDRHYLRLSPSERQQVSMVMRTGRASPDASVNAVAIDRLQKAALSPTADRIALIVLPMVLAIPPVVAAIRVSPWWLLSVLPVLLMGFGWNARRDRPDPRTTLQDLRRAMGGAH